MTTQYSAWLEENQRQLVGALREVRAALERHIARASGPSVTLDPVRDAAEPAPPGGAEGNALDSLCTTFGLSPFERATLLLCAGPELDASFSRLCADAQGDALRSYPTFSLALAALPGAHWSALSPNAPLRRWRLVDVVNQPGIPLTVSPLRIDERILHFLTGIQHLDERLVGLLDRVAPSGALVPSHRVIAQRLSASLSLAHTGGPAIQLCGADVGSKRSVAAVGCAEAGLNLFALASDAIPFSPGDCDSLLRLWEREAVLTRAALYVDADSLDAIDNRTVASIGRLVERVRGPLIVGTRDPLHLPGNQFITLDIQRPNTGEQRAVWVSALSGAAQKVNGCVDRLVGQFDLSETAIPVCVRQALNAGSEGDALAAALWDAARQQARPRLDDLAQRIAPAATWDDLVLPPSQREMLHEIVVHVRQRNRVYQSWGFVTKGTRGLGISALFAGPSGTGKTMAAEVLANDLRLDLYRIDLSQVVSKYIGETEKNLRRVFDAAEEGGAILLFDEADALFGKRSEVKDSHDRYANIEVGYLLQRMERYRGLAILTTNMKQALDAAFLRRIRFILQFPFPDTAARADIWQRVFPRETPTEGLDASRLARLNVAGGSIRNIALNAAFLAADASEPVRMTHLLRAARSEYAKLEQPLTDAELGRWT